MKHYRIIAEFNNGKFEQEVKEVKLKIYKMLKRMRKEFDEIIAELMPHELMGHEFNCGKTKISKLLPEQIIKLTNMKEIK